MLLPNALGAASPLAKYLEVARRTETKYKTWEEVAEEVTKSIIGHSSLSHCMVVNIGSAEK